MIGLPIGLFYANAVEWVVHKYVLHGLGKKKGSMFSFHWKAHHRSSRQFEMYDPDYEKPIYDPGGRGKEVAGILAIMAVHTPLAPVAPWFTAAVWYAGLNYLYKHKKCHLDVEWGKKHMRSHYDHHMGVNQDTNWCVTRPWFDLLMGTRSYMADDEAAPKGKLSTAKQLLRELTPKVLLSELPSVAANDTEEEFVVAGGLVA